MKTDLQKYTIIRNARSNFKVVMMVLLMAAVTCLVLSKYIQGRETAGMFRITGLVFLVAAILQLVAFVIYTALYKNKRQVK